MKLVDWYIAAQKFCAGHIFLLDNFVRLRFNLNLKKIAWCVLAAVFSFGAMVMLFATGMSYDQRMPAGDVAILGGGAVIIFAAGIFAGVRVALNGKWHPEVRNVRLRAPSL